LGRARSRSGGVDRIVERILCPATGREDHGVRRSRWAMAMRIICMCGYVIQGDDEDELWINTQRHMSVLHPELVDNVTREDILAQAELV
jgi:predicted small metal-binding protein